MPAELSESILSPTALLWLVVSVAAAIILFGSIHRRRTRLTESLRDFVDHNQGDRPFEQPTRDEDTTD